MNIPDKKQYSESDLLTLVSVFADEYKNPFHYNYKKKNIVEIRNDSTFLKSLKNECGIYYFIQNGKIKYVGRALPNVGLASRVKQQINAFGDLKWDKVIKDDSVDVGILSIEKERWYVIASLEVYLIHNLENPEFNKRL